MLRDGHTVHVRPIVPADEERLLRFHERQSPESVYFRYFSPRPRLSERDLRHLTGVDHHDRVAFVALAGGEMIGVARYERYRGTDTAEVAFFVDDDHHGRGLATLLLEYLVAAGLDNGLRRFTATTLPNNRKMLKVFQAAGYDVSSRLDEGVVEVAFDIDPTRESLAAMDRRERLAEAASVRPLLWPTSVAVVGAGRGRGGLGGEVFRNVVDNGFVGAVHPVNQEADEVAGVAALRSVDDLPDGVDLAVVATPAADVPGIVERCGRRGVRAVAVLSAGFSEAGQDGLELERAAVEAARRHGMRLLGPNCLGVINTDPAVRLDATLVPDPPPHGSVALLAEAGTLSAAIVEHARRVDLGISTMVAAGNRADLGPSDLLSCWAADDGTAAVLMYLGAQHLTPRFVRAARAASLSKPVAALHTSMAASPATPWSPRPTVGRSGEAARRAQAMFRQTGVISVGSLEQLVDVGRILADQPAPAGRGVAVVGNSDGAVALAADACSDAGLELVPVEVARGDGSTTVNPVDLSHRAGAADFADALAAVAGDPRVDSVLVISTPPRLDWDADLGQRILAASAANPDVTFVATLLGAAGRGRLCGPPTDSAEPTAVPIFRFPEGAAAALGRLAGYRAWRGAVDTAGTVDRVGDPDRARELVEAALAARAGADDERPVRCDLREQDELLAACGVEVIERVTVADTDEAVAAAERIGWPVALKAATRNRLTRAVASGVALDLGDPGQLRSTWDRMHAALGDAMFPVVVQRFVEAGLDASVSVRREDDGSGTVEVGLGGPAAILDEKELALLPLTMADAATLVASSPIGRVLTDPLDRVPLVEVVHRLAGLVEDLDEVRAVHADPVVCSPVSARVADVRVELGDPVDDFDVRRLE